MAELPGSQTLAAWSGIAAEVEASVVRFRTSSNEVQTKLGQCATLYARTEHETAGSFREIQA